MAQPSVAAQPVPAVCWDVEQERDLIQGQHLLGHVPEQASPLEAAPDELPAGPAQPWGAGPGFGSACDEILSHQGPPLMPLALGLLGHPPGHTSLG